MNLKSNLLRASLFALALFATVVSQAVNKLYIDDFSISDYGTVNVPLMIENSDEVTQIQVEAVIPASLEVMAEDSQFVFNEEYLPLFMRSARKFVQADGSTIVKIDILNFNGKAMLNPGGGMLLEIPVAPKAGLLSEDGTAQIDLRKILIVGPDSSRIQESTASSTTVTLNKKVKSMSLSCTNSPVIINPGDTRRAVVSMTNNYDVMAMSFVLYLPEHVTVAEVTGTSRVPMDMDITVTQREGSVKVMLFGMPTLCDPIAPGEGELLNISLAADAEFFAGGTVNVKYINGSDPNAVSVDGEDISFELTSGQVAYENAYVMIQGEGGLNEYITNAINTVAEECPLVADDFSFTPFVNEVQQLWNAVEVAFNDYSLTDNFDAIVTEPVAIIKQEVDTFVADARAAQAAEEQRRADNQTAYQGDIAAIDALQASLDAAKAQIREQYAGYEDEAAEAAVQAQIDALRAAADAALAAVAEEGNYESTLDTAAVEAAIAALVTDAENAKAAEDARVAANQEAYQADIAAIDALQAAFDAAKAEISETYPGFDNTEKENEVQSLIDALRAEVEAAYAAVAEAGNYEYTLDTTAVEAAIEAMKEYARENAAVAGDVDGDREVGPIDLQMLLNMISNGEADEFDPENPAHKAADMNGDGRISVVDAIAIVDLITGASAANVRMQMAAAAPQAAVARIQAVEASNVNGIRSMRVYLANPADFVGGQFDLIIPAGMSIISESLSERMAGMEMVTGNPAAGKHRVVFISSELEGMEGSEGAVLDLEVIGNGDIYVENALFVDRQGNTYAGTDPGTTGIDGIYGTAAGAQKVYDTAGRMVNKLQKGVNIIVDGTGKAVKVYRK